MSFKSICTILHDTDAPTDALEYAIQAARKWDAHLHVLCAGINRTEPGFYYGGASAMVVENFLDDARESAAQLQHIVKARLAVEDIRWDVDTVSILSTGLVPFISDYLRFNDIAILPLPYQAPNHTTDVAMFEACIFGAKIPAIVVPKGCVMPPELSRILVAWNDSTAALAAARASLPLVEEAAVTDICVIDPPLDGLDRSDPGGRLAQMMVRYGANVEITTCARLDADIALQLQKKAQETAAQLIVMGGYGHSRLREAVIGGTTRSMLQHAKVPVLMAH